MINKAYFYDDYDNYYYARISINESLLNITAHNDNGDEVGHIEIMIGDRLILNEIICGKEYKRMGIGTALIDIFEYLCKDYTGIVYGMYVPLNTALSVVENDQITRAFYQKNGYQVVSRTEFKENPNLYPGLSLEDFNTSSRIYNHSIIYKQSLKKDEYRFKESNNELVEDNKVKVLNW